MVKKEEAATQRRRNFLKAAGGTVAAFGAAKIGLAQSSSSESSSQKKTVRSAPPDRGIWITWYDLPAEGREAYFSWLHGKYLPGILKRPGYLWAAQLRFTGSGRRRGQRQALQTYR